MLSIRIHINSIYSSSHTAYTKNVIAHALPSHIRMIDIVGIGTALSHVCVLALGRIH